MSAKKNISVTSGSSSFGNTFRVTCDGDNIEVPGEKGICVVAFDKDFKNPTLSKLFECTDQASCNAFCSSIDKIKDGSYLVLGYKGNSLKNFTSECKKTISTLGSKEINRLEDRESWALITKKGSNSVLEYRQPNLVNFSYNL